MNTNATSTGTAVFPKAGRIVRENSNDMKIEVDGRGCVYLKADDRARLIWNEQVRVYTFDGDLFHSAGFARLSRSGKAIMFFIGQNIYMTPLSLVRRLFQGTTDKCILSLYIDAEPVHSDIRAGLATGFD
jgi:hypothetical protein